MGKSTINGHFPLLCLFTRGYHFFIKNLWFNSLKFQHLLGDVGSSPESRAPDADWWHFLPSCRVWSGRCQTTSWVPKTRQFHSNMLERLMRLMHVDASPIYPVLSSPTHCRALCCSKSHQSILAIFDDLHRLEKRWRWRWNRIAGSRWRNPEAGPLEGPATRSDWCWSAPHEWPSHRLETSSTRAANSDIP